MPATSISSCAPGRARSSRSTCWSQRSARHSPRAGHRRGGPGNAAPATALSAGAPARDDHGPHVRDRIPRYRRRGVRLHLRLATGSAFSGAGASRCQRDDPSHAASRSSSSLTNTPSPRTSLPGTHPGVPARPSFAVSISSGCSGSGASNRPKPTCQAASPGPWKVFVESRDHWSGDDIRVTRSSDLIDVGDASRKAAYNARICRCADG